jgi:phosphotransacetylase
MELVEMNDYADKIKTVIDIIDSYKLTQKEQDIKSNIEKIVESQKHKKITLKAAREQLAKKFKK